MCPGKGSVGLRCDFSLIMLVGQRYLACGSTASRHEARIF